MKNVNNFFSNFIRFNIMFLSFILLINLAFSFTGGDGFSSTPYEISTCSDLQDVSNYLDSDFILINDIDCTNFVFTSIGPIFTGEFDGSGLVIYGLFINESSNYVGLFSEINRAKISSVGLVNIYVSGNNYVGGFVGRANKRSEILNSYVVGEVTGNNFVGGFVGSSSSRNVFSNSYTNINVTGKDFVGGFVGSLKTLSILTDSYSLGLVSGENFVGGLTGMNLLSGVYNSFSDIAVSGENSAGSFSGVSLISAVVGSYSNSRDDNPDLMFGLGGILFSDLTKILDDSTYFFGNSNSPVFDWNSEDWSFSQDDYPWLSEYFINLDDGYGEYNSLDTLAPKTEFLHAELRNSLLMYLDAKDEINGSGLSHFNYCVDDSDTCDPFLEDDRTYGLRFEVECLNEWNCDKFVRYSSVDNAGNVEELKSDKFKISGVGNTCTQSCISVPLPDRYLKSCNHLNSCQFYEYDNYGTFDGGDYVSNLCDFALVDAYAKFNSTHDIKCPAGPFRKNVFSDEETELLKSECENLIYNNYPVLIEGESVIMKVYTCVDS